MKKHFFTGLALLLPLVLTVLIVLFFLNLLTRPFLGVIENYLNSHGWFSNRDLLQFAGRLIVLTFIILFVILIGFLGQVFLTRFLFSVTEKVMLQIPFVSKIYKSAKEVVHTLLDSSQTRFSQVVLVPFPQKGSQSIGFVTSECLPEGSDKDHEGYLSVFVPGTPNPTMGFMLMFHRDDVTFIDMKIDEALKLIISCGVMSDKITEKR